LGNYHSKGPPLFTHFGKLRMSWADGNKLTSPISSSCC